MFVSARFVEYAGTDLVIVEAEFLRDTHSDTEALSYRKSAGCEVWLVSQVSGYLKYALVGLLVDSSPAV